MIGEIVRVEIVLALLLHLGAVVVDILQAAGEALSPALLNICHSGIDGHIGSVGLGGCGQQHSGLRQWDAGLRQAKLHSGIHTGFYYDNGLWIGQADVLRCNDQQTAARRKQIPGLQQATQVMHRGIGIGAADGFCRAERRS